jgi:hypothetical protein
MYGGHRGYYNKMSGCVKFDGIVFMSISEAITHLNQLSEHIQVVLSE